MIAQRIPNREHETVQREVNAQLRLRGRRKWIARRATHWNVIERPVLMGRNVHVTPVLITAVAAVPEVIAVAGFAEVAVEDSGAAVVAGADGGWGSSKSDGHCGA
jgi:hypothetical protein